MEQTSRAGLSLAAACCLFAVALPAAAGEDRAASRWRPGQLATRLDEIVPAVGSCWRAPAGLRSFETMAVTVRFALRDDGSLLGEPRISYARTAGGETARSVLARSAIAAVRSCTPVALSPALGRAIAGRIFSIRFTYEGPQGRGA